MPEDHLLVDAILHGDACAESRFVAEYQPVFERTFLRITGNRHLAEDLVQDMFEAVFAADCDKLRRWQGRSTLKTYLLKVARNLALDRIRSRLYRPAGRNRIPRGAGYGAPRRPARAQSGPTRRQPKKERLSVQAMPDRKLPDPGRKRLMNSVPRTWTVQLRIFLSMNCFWPKCSRSVQAPPTPAMSWLRC